MAAVNNLPGVDQFNGITLKRWVLTTADGTGDALPIPIHPDKAVQVSGTFGGATCLIEGSLNGTTWETLRDPAGAALSFTAAGLKQILETVAFIRPRLSVAGSGASINVDLCGGKTE